MNRAKIMLSALSILAVVGSALAFRAHTIYADDLKCSAETTSAGAPPIAGSLCPHVTYKSTTAGGEVRHCKLIIAGSNVACATARVTIKQ